MTRIIDRKDFIEHLGRYSSELEDPGLILGDSPIERSYALVPNGTYKKRHVFLVHPAAWITVCAKAGLFNVSEQSAEALKNADEKVRIKYSRLRNRGLAKEKLNG